MARQTMNRQRARRIAYGFVYECILAGNPRFADVMVKEEYEAMVEEEFEKIKAEVKAKSQ